MSTKVAGSEGLMGRVSVEWTSEDNGYDDEQGGGGVGWVLL